MKSSKGFTLIELLAVIVILAIIALIAAPVILGIIDDARKSAAKDSAYGVVASAKLHFAQTLMNTDKAPQFGPTEDERIFSCVKDGDCTTTVDGKKITISVDGTVPGGTFTLNNSGLVNSTAGLTFNGKYCFKVTNNVVSDCQ